MGRRSEFKLRVLVCICDCCGVTNDEDHQVIAQGLAAFATTFFEMGDSAVNVRTKLVAYWASLGSPAGAFRAAATAVGGQPQPVVESAEVTERSRPIRELLGVVSAESQLVASLRARELLDDLAAELE